MKKQQPRGKNLELDPQLHTELRIAAAKSGVSMKSIVTQLVKEFLKGFHGKD
jgi:predicted HicB family RNase H-like nuclease